ncbi:MAG TPA: cobalt-precorrin-5B (C(1))-methyltransferase CbiD [Candidatus Scalindua sp.]|jgi:cobalt-precorrin-5B (C1)-methyltransferase|nr:cobalt-precorrin-5B (C(1))-methyltransferase CbiD [Candidatus Scalindua sp.]
MKHNYGYTTGSCAAGAAKGAAYGLLQGTIPDTVDLTTPADVTLKLNLIHRRVGKDFAECAVRKYSGDDPDITNGCEVYVRVTRSEANGVRFIGGDGVGLVTKPGLQISQGEPAINPVPRSMIKDSLKEVLGKHGGLEISVSVPEGKKLAKKTFNGRLGIVDGISIIGTTGIVRPMSLDSFKVSLLCGLDVAKAAGHDSIVLVPGSIGETGFLKHFNISKYQVIQMSNFVGFMLDEAVKRGFRNVIIGGHPGKLAKLIRGDFNTHSSKSKPANDILIKIFKREKISSALINELNDSSTVEGMVEIIKEHNFMQVFDRIADDVQSAAGRHILSKAKIGTILFDMRKNIIGVSKGFKDWQKSL